MDNELRSTDTGKKLLRGTAVQQLLGFRGAASIVKVEGSGHIGVYRNGDVW
jgi:hypothetical protein